jgi:hypothetical protein
MSAVHLAQHNLAQRLALQIANHKSRCPDRRAQAPCLAFLFLPFHLLI